MSVVAVDWNRGRPGGRVFVLDRRCHHGLVGASLVAAGLVAGGPLGTAAIVVGTLAMCHDGRDFPWLPSRR